MLIGAIDTLSGDLLTYFLMRELSGGTSKFKTCTSHYEFEVLPESSLIKKYVSRPPDSTSMAPISIATMHDTTLQSI